MNKIRVKTSVNEYHNIHYYAEFEIVDEKPEAEEDFNKFTGTRIADVFPVCADLHLNNIYTPDCENYFSLWGVKILTDEEDASCVEYKYYAVPEPDDITESAVSTTEE